MVDIEPDWSLYRTFLAVVRAGSFSAAARLTGSTQPTIGRQIQALEATLGLKLFSRSQRGLLPTPAARNEITIEQEQHMRAVDVAVASGHDPVDRGFIRSGIHRKVLPLSPE